MAYDALGVVENGAFCERTLSATHSSPQPLGFALSARRFTFGLPRSTSGHGRFQRRWIDLFSAADEAMLRGEAVKLLRFANALRTNQDNFIENPENA